MKQYVGLDVSQKETSGLACWGHRRHLSVEDEWQGRRLPSADKESIMPAARSKYPPAAVSVHRPAGLAGPRLHGREPLCDPAHPLIFKCGVPPLSDVDDAICLRRMQRTDCTKLPGAGW